ncbi:MAG TPA: hypothetical protein VGR47_00060 [Terracidiphilus sp.]|nr:hypothetical protein [Terracidiphilus sp.]
MEVIESDGFAHLANLRSELKLAEAAGSLDTYDLELKNAREAVLHWVKSFQHSRYELGRAILRYKTYFKKEGSWTRAAKLIAESIGTSERTVHRIAEEYEFASHLPEITRDAMVEQKLDPAAGKNAGVVGKLLEMPPPQTREEAAAMVKSASQADVEMKRSGRKVVAETSPKDGLDQFAQHILRQFKEHYRSATPERRDAEVRYILELVVNTVGADVHELRQYDRPALVPKPEARKAA